MKNDPGSIIKSIRKRKGLKQIFVASKAGISNRYLSAIETGKKEPSITVLENIANVLGVPITDFFSFKREHTTENKFRNDPVPLEGNQDSLEYWEGTNHSLE